MLNITPIRGNSSHAAAHYFSSSDNYYAKEEAGQWQGEGAKILGLEGSVEQAQFARLLGGQLPDGSRIDTTFNDKDAQKRMGLDLTFSAPKSVSMQALIGGDRRVTEAHDRAVTRALMEVEKLAETRKKVKGKSYRERTGKMVIGKFRHEMSRAKDPQLHTHAVIANMTQREDGKWRALANEDIFRTYNQIDGVYKAELAHELKALGYAIRVTDELGNFELDHISRTQIEAFSDRSRVIEEALEKEGKTRATATTREKQVISLATRQKKEKGDLEIIKQWWLEKSSDLGIAYEKPTGRTERTEHTYGPFMPDTEPKPDPTLSPARAVLESAIRHLAERESVIAESVLITQAMRNAVGTTVYREVKAEVARLVAQGTLIVSEKAYRPASDKNAPGFTAAQWQATLEMQYGFSREKAKKHVNTSIQTRSLVESEPHYTTQAALKREKAILAIERDGRQQVTPIMATKAIQKALEDISLTPGQRNMVEALVGTENRFIGVQGDAGTGKTYAVRQAQLLIDQANAEAQKRDPKAVPFRIVALAPYGNQVKALKNEGMEAHTLAGFLHTVNKPVDANTVILLDESAVVGARQMAQLMKIVETTGSRLVMAGDTKQTGAIEAGKPFAQLQRAGMQTIRLSEIQRQQDAMLKAAVAHAADGKTALSLECIRNVYEVAKPDARHAVISGDFVSLSPAERDKTLIIAGTNAARQEINQMVRQELKLADTGRKFKTLTRVDLTQEERRMATSYKSGMIVQVEKDYDAAGLKRGEIYTVREKLAGNELSLATGDGRSIIINPRKLSKLSVYTQESTELAVGDVVRMNRNSPKEDITNGDRMRVAAVMGGIVTLESIEQKDGKPVRTLALLANKPLHLEYAYSSTVHSSQGLTSDRVLISLDTKSRTTSANLYYVAVSRARHEANIYTDSKQNLPEAIARRFEKTAALEVKRRKPERRTATDGAASGQEFKQRKQSGPADGAAHEYGPRE